MILPTRNSYQEQLPTRTFECEIGIRVGIDKGIETWRPLHPECRCLNVDKERARTKRRRCIHDTRGLPRAPVAVRSAIHIRRSTISTLVNPHNNLRRPRERNSPQARSGCVWQRLVSGRELLARPRVFYDQETSEGRFD